MSYADDPYVGGGTVPPGSTLARRTDPRARRKPPERGADGLIKPPVTLTEIEEKIMRCDEELADLVDDHFRAAEEAAEAEARWKAHRDRVLVKIADRGDREAADIREARAKVQHVDAQDPLSPTGEDLYRTYKLTEATEKSVDRAMKALQSRMMGLMSVARGVRGSSGLDH